MDDRTDYRTATRVYLAVTVAAVHGPAAGAHFLISRGVPLDLARRVLLRPTERRRYLAFTALQASNRSTTRP